MIGVAPTPPFLVVSFWGCFLGFSVVWRVFWGCFDVVLLLNSYCLATVLLELLVGVVSGCFSGCFRCLAGFSGVVGISAAFLWVLGGCFSVSFRWLGVCSIP